MSGKQTKRSRTEAPADRQPGRAPGEQQERADGERPRGAVGEQRWRDRLREDRRLREPAWVLLPLRVFLGVTFLYAGLSKLFDAHYLDPASPLGVRSQMAHAAAGSPISALVTFSSHHATVVGLLIAFGEVAAGLGVLVGLFTRLAAVLGALLALSFFLTVSWRTSPYYYGPDIVFVFAWMPMILAGDGDLFSVTEAIRRRVRRRMHLSARPPTARTGRESLAVGREVDRRTLLGSGALAGAVGALVVFVGGGIALSRRPDRGGGTAAGASPSAGSPPASSLPASGQSGQGRTIVQVSDVKVGGAKSFTAANGDPAWLLHPNESTFTAFSAVCTHEGCPVQWANSGFECPCHGATFDEKGKVTGGPARGPLPSIPVTVADGQVRTT